MHACAGSLSSIDRAWTKQARQRGPSRKNTGLAHIHRWYRHCSSWRSKSHSSGEGHAGQPKARAGATVIRIFARLGRCRERHRRGTEGSTRSEEHTSELQSRGHLVCRLLLEKKKHLKNISTSTLLPESELFSRY